MCAWVVCVSCDGLATRPVTAMLRATWRKSDQRAAGQVTAGVGAQSYRTSAIKGVPPGKSLYLKMKWAHLNVSDILPLPQGPTLRWETVMKYHENRMRTNE